MYEFPIQVSAVTIRGQKCYVKEFSYGEAKIFEKVRAGMQEEGAVKEDLVREIVLISACNEKGERAFKAEEQLEKLPHAVLLEFFKAAMRANSLDGEAVEREKKESSPITSSDTSTVSHAA